MLKGTDLGLFFFFFELKDPKRKKILATYMFFLKGSPLDGGLSLSNGQRADACRRSG